MLSSSLLSARMAPKAKAAVSNTFAATSRALGALDTAWRTLMAVDAVDGPVHIRLHDGRVLCASTAYDARGDTVLVAAVNGLARTGGTATTSATAATAATAAVVTRSRNDGMRTVTASSPAALVAAVYGADQVDRVRDWLSAVLVHGWERPAGSGPPPMRTLPVRLAEVSVDAMRTWRTVAKALPAGTRVRLRSGTHVSRPAVVTVVPPFPPFLVHPDGGEAFPNVAAFAAAAINSNNAVSVDAITWESAPSTSWQNHGSVWQRLEPSSSVSTRPHEPSAQRPPSHPRVALPQRPPLTQPRLLAPQRPQLLPQLTLLQEPALQVQSRRVPLLSTRQQVPPLLLTPTRQQVPPPATPSQPTARLRSVTMMDALVRAGLLRPGMAWAFTRDAAAAAAEPVLCAVPSRTGLGVVFITGAGVEAPVGYVDVRRHSGQVVSDAMHAASALVVPRFTSVQAWATTMPQMSSPTWASTLQLVTAPGVSRALLLLARLTLDDALLAARALLVDAPNRSEHQALLRMHTVLQPRRAPDATMEDDDSEPEILDVLSCNDLPSHLKKRKLG